MKALLVLLLLAGLAACKGNEVSIPKSPVTQLVIYDTVMSEATRFRIKYQIPIDYAMIYDTAVRKYIVQYIFGDIDKRMYLRRLEPFGIITLYGTRPYATEFNRASDAVKAIKSHHADVLADRASNAAKPK